MVGEGKHIAAIRIVRHRKLRALLLQSQAHYTRLKAFESEATRRPQSDYLPFYAKIGGLIGTGYYIMQVIVPP